MIIRVWVLCFALAAVAWPQPRPIGRRVAISPGSKSRVIHAPAEFRAVGCMGAAMDLQVRASADGVRWTEWQKAEPDSEASGLIYYGERMQYLEYAAPPTRSGAASFLFIDPGESTGTPAPPIVSRAGWGCTPTTCPSPAPPSYTTVTHLIVHHTAMANTATDWAAVMRSIWVLHVQGNGWNDIGYNYLIDPNGVLYEGRAGGDGVLGAHFSGVNSGTMGVSMMGTYSTVPVTDAARNTLRAMLIWQADKWNLDASGKALHTSSGLMLDVISGHRDANLSTAASGSTECPGNGLYTILPALRREVYAAQAGACPITVASPARCVPASAGSVTVAVSAPAECSWKAASGTAWIAAQAGAAGVALDIGVNSGARRTGTVSIGGHTVTVVQAGASEGLLPCVEFRGIAPVSSSASGPAAPNAIVSIYGSNFGDESATSVTVDGKAATLFYAGPNQINALIPPATNIGSARMAVKVKGVTGPDAYFSVSEASPAILEYGDARAVAQNYDDGKVNGPDAPVRPGGIVTVYLTAAGPSTPWSATVAGVAATGMYLGPTPGFMGLYQANIVVPSGVSAADVPLVITVSGAPSSPVTLTVGAH